MLKEHKDCDCQECREWREDRIWGLWFGDKQEVQDDREIQPKDLSVFEE